MTDIEIANSVLKKDLVDVASTIGITRDDLVLYGNDKAKIKDVNKGKDGKLVLVTAISPTPYGEGKTTVSIGLNDAFNKLNKSSVAVLRQPSMGPVFGMKGGATGGGYSQVIPMEDINLHFTGDFHAISAANNLLCAAIDNSIYFGNKLNIKKILFKRCLDVNDRSLRKIMINDELSSFNITAASEIMALFCLATSLDDLKRRLGNIVIGYNNDGGLVYCRDLGVEGSMTVLLKDAFLPNLVQSLENNPVIIHGGPFANIAHGCNSIVATKTGLDLCDYVITEAGFGADLGAEKFLDIKCRELGKGPNAIVLVATIKALKYHGGVDKENIMIESVESVKKGLPNLERHINNLKKFGVNIVVCLNKYNTDTEEEIDIVRDLCNSLDVSFSTSTAYIDGGNGAIDLCNKVIDACNKESNFNLLYENDMSIVEKVNIVCKEIYRANNVTFSDKAMDMIDLINHNNLSHLPICVAKTQYSFSDDAKKLGAPEYFSVNVVDINLYNGAEFITILLGNIMTMPGLSRNPNYLNIDLIDDKIVGIN